MRDDKSIIAWANRSLDEVKEHDDAIIGGLCAYLDAEIAQHALTEAWAKAEQKGRWAAEEKLMQARTEIELLKRALEGTQK